MAWSPRAVRQITSSNTRPGHSRVAATLVLEYTWICLRCLEHVPNKCSKDILANGGEPHGTIRINIYQIDMNILSGGIQE